VRYFPLRPWIRCERGFTLNYTLRKLVVIKSDQSVFTAWRVLHYWTLENLKLSVTLVLCKPLIAVHCWSWHDTAGLVNVPPYKFALCWLCCRERLRWPVMLAQEAAAARVAATVPLSARDHVARTQRRIRRRIRRRQTFMFRTNATTILHRPVVLPAHLHSISPLTTPVLKQKM